MAVCAYISYYIARGLFVCLFPIQIGAAVRCAAKRAMPAEGAWGVFLEDRRATTCSVAEERAKYF